MKNKNADRYRTIGQAIKLCRLERGLTQEQLADAVGISLSYLTKIEAPNSNKPFSLEVVFDISDTLGVHALRLLENIK